MLVTFFSPLGMVYRGKYGCHNLLSNAKTVPIEQAPIKNELPAL
jgi:hypothetical protein